MKTIIILTTLVAWAMTGCRSGKSIPSGENDVGQASGEEIGLDRASIIDRLLESFFFVSKEVSSYQIDLNTDLYLRDQHDRHMSRSIGEIEMIPADILELLEGIHRAKSSRFGVSVGSVKVYDFKYGLHVGILEFKASNEGDGLRITLSTSKEGGYPDDEIEFFLSPGNVDLKRKLGPNLFGRSKKTEKVMNVGIDRISFSEKAESGDEISFLNLERLSKKKSRLQIREPHSSRDGRLVEATYEFNPYKPLE